MSIKKLLITSIASLVVFTGCSSNGYADGAYGEAKAPSSVVQKVMTTEGEVFATKDGLSLYIFTKDVANQSNCYDSCAASWPPFYATENANEWGEFSVIERKDGTYQWAYSEQPLYTWAGDQKQGDVNGQGIGQVWYVINTPN